MIWWLPLGAVVSMEAFCTRPFRQASINSPHSPQPSSACLISPLPCPRLNRHASRTRKGSSGSPVSNMRCSSPSCRHQRQPTDPNTVYVPYYNPAVVYGAWSYPAYPPYYFPPAAGYVPVRRSPLVWRLGLAMPSDAGPMGAIIGAAVAIGATTTSTSIEPTISTSINGSITPIIAAAWHVA